MRRHVPRALLASVVLAGLAVGPAALASGTPLKQKRLVAKCMTHAALVHVHQGSSGVWDGSVRSTTWTVFAEGPYKTSASAAASARSLAGIEDAASGGRWVVSAAIRAHVQATVHKVARCLQRAGTG